MDPDEASHMSFFEDSFQTYLKALDAIAKHNAILRREIFAGDSVRAKCVALKAALDAAVQENQALQDDRLKNAEEADVEGALASQRGDTEAEKRLVCEEIKAIHQKLFEQINSVVIDQRGEASEKEKQRCVEMETENSRLLEENEAITDACKELQKKLSPLQTNKTECEKLEEANKTLRQQNVNLHQKLQHLSSQVSQMDYDLCPAEIEAENQRILEENEALEDTCNELQTKLSLSNKERAEREEKNKTLHKQKKLKHLETVKDDCDQLETEIKSLLIEKTHLGQELDRLLAKIDEDKSEERHHQLEAEKDKLLEQRDTLQHKIYKTLMKLAKEECWAKKSETLEVSKRALVKENEELEEHLDKLTRTLDQIKVKHVANTDAYEEVQSLKRYRAALQGEIDRKQLEIIHKKVRLACLKNIDKEKAEIKAERKKLQKKYEKLEKKCEKLGDPAEEIENETLEKSLVWEENAAFEKTYLEKTHEGLKKQMSGLEEGGKKRLVDELLQKQQAYEEEFSRQRAMNEEQQEQYEELYRQVFNQELLEISNNIKKQAIEEMKELSESRGGRSRDTGRV
ncbi:hypothetical protein WMY93_017886 [Mugilogobius chulae]|uniref:Uncharacterized protein n=1 Tax=Mugilogobius chulae TaxID=88201 RepID=A0AAW0NT96_9GOBI